MRLQQGILLQLEEECLQKNRLWQQEEMVKQTEQVRDTDMWPKASLEEDWRLLMQLSIVHESQIQKMQTNS